MENNTFRIRHRLSRTVLTPFASLLVASCMMMQASTASAQPDNILDSGLTLNQVFQLHSRPGATTTAYIDFTGPTFKSFVYAINMGLDANADIDTTPLDIDGNPGSFSRTEIDYMAAVWRGVSESYAMFDVDVTTQRPSVVDENTLYAVVTGVTDSTGAPMPVADVAVGFAFRDSWGDPAKQARWKALIYPKERQPLDVARTVAHEWGHNLGLRHTRDATGVQTKGLGSYLPQRRDWCAMMGIGKSCAISQWHDGSAYPGGTTADEIAIISGKIGFAADDHGNSVNDATDLVVSDGGFINVTQPHQDPWNQNKANKGIVGSRNDVDVFKFSSPGGYTRLVVSTLDEGFSRGTTLEPWIVLLDAYGSPVAQSTPGKDLTINTIYRQLDQGDYYLAVFGSALTRPQSITDYGSVGQYFISGYIQGYPGSVVDRVSPLPNVPRWRYLPISSADDAITMTAASSVDHTGVKYLFACVSGDGCRSSSWQSSTEFTARGLQTGTDYRFRVLTKDGAGNVSAWSEDVSVTARVCPAWVAKQGGEGFGELLVANQSVATLPRQNRCFTPGEKCGVRFVSSLSREGFDDPQPGIATCTNGHWVEE